jgi:hypothetical protein
MKTIKLYNRDGADLYLEKIDSKNPGLWKLKADDKYLYVLEYMRIIGTPEQIEAVDPSGGPMIGLGDKFEGKYKVVGFKDPITLIISEYEGNNN